MGFDFDYHITSYLDNHYCSFSYISITRDAVGSKENWRLKIDIGNDVNPTENRRVYVKRIKLATLKKNTEILRQYIAVVTVVVIFWIVTTITLSINYVRLKTKNNDLKDAFETYRKFIHKGGNEVLF